MKYLLSYKNEYGQSIDFNDERFKIVKFEGFGDAGADVQSQKSPFQDGSTHIDTLLNERAPYLEFLIMSIEPNDIHILRKLVSQVFNPKVSGTFFLEIEGNTYIIKGVPDHLPFFPDGSGNQGRSFQRVSIDVICHDPYWKSLVIEEDPTFEPLFEFPFEGEFEMGIQRDKRTINNDSDTQIPIQVEFYGPATNPKITNLTTGEFIKVNQALGENEYMKIDTTPGNKSVFFVDQNGVERNVFNWIDLNSTFFQLIIGENEIQYSADSDIQGAIVNIFYQKHYVGV